MHKGGLLFGLMCFHILFSNISERGFLLCFSCIILIYRPDSHCLSLIRPFLKGKGGVINSQMGIWLPFDRFPMWKWKSSLQECVFWQQDISFCAASANGFSCSESLKFVCCGLGVWRKES